MNLLMILYFALISPPIQDTKTTKAPVEMTSIKLMKPAKKPIEESSVYHYAPTKWIKISKKI